MDNLAERCNYLSSSATVLMFQKALALEAEGKRILNLTAGESDFKTPDHVKQAAIDALHQDKTRYTPVAGIMPLREAICAKFKTNGLPYTTDQIMVGCGSKQLIFNAFFVTLDPGDEVIIPAPYWVSYVGIVRSLGGTPVLLPCTMEEGFELSPGRLAAAITPRTKWLVLNNPCNPSGVLYSRETLQALASVLMEPENHHVWVLADDMYEHIVFDGRSFCTMAQVEPRLLDRALTVNGLSKAYCMTGWRVGFCGGPVPLIKMMERIQSQSTTHTSSISQWAGVAALEGPQDFLRDNTLAFQERRDKVVSWIREIPHMSCLMPQGTFYLYINCRDLIGKTTPSGDVLSTDEACVHYFLTEVGVALVHGAAFGLSPFMRLSYATSLDILEEACDGLKKACARLRL